MKKIPAPDDIDFLILRTLSMYPEINQVELSKKVRLTQPAISGRLRKLQKLGILSSVNARVDPKALGLKVAKIDMHVRDGSTILEKFRRCPLIANSYAYDDNGLCMIVVGESKQIINCFASEHLAKNGSISDVRTETVTESLNGFRTNMDVSKKLDVPPCGDHPCNECEYYIDNGGECVGCPMTKFYKGSLWSSP